MNVCFCMYVLGQRNVCTGRNDLWTSRGSWFGFVNVVARAQK